MKERDLARRRTRQDRLLRERVHDPYKTRLKLTEPTVCPDCGAVYRQGRWNWAPAAPGANEVRCQACHRTRDGQPAGTVTLRGAFLKGHRTEILNLAHNQEAEEKAEHPLHRIMQIEDKPAEIVITTTDIHLPRRIGEALYRAFEGHLDYHYDEESYLIRVSWTRDV